MIRGAIEIASRSTVAGWLYSKKFNLHGQLLLAFVGDRHVGSGRIEIFRKDILKAGLGDGYSGFYFSVELRAGEAPESINVRLEECDMALLHPDAMITGKERVQERVPERTQERSLERAPEKTPERVPERPLAKPRLAGPDGAFAHRMARTASQWRQAQG